MPPTLKDISNCHDEECLKSIGDDLINLHKTCYNKNNGSWDNKKCNNITKEEFDILLMEYLSLALYLEKQGVKIFASIANLNPILRTMYHRNDRSMENIRNVYNNLINIYHQNNNMEY